MRGDGWAWRAEIGGLNYEGLPPEVGAFKFKNGLMHHGPFIILLKNGNFTAISGD